MATRSCQNDEILLSIAQEVGRKAYFLGLDIDFNRYWYSPVEHDAFVAGWLEAAEDSFHQRHATTSFGTGNRVIMN